MALNSLNEPNIKLNILLPITACIDLNLNSRSLTVGQYNISL